MLKNLEGTVALGEEAERLNYIVLSVFCLRQEAKAVSRTSVRTVLRAAAVASSIDRILQPDPTLYTDLQSSRHFEMRSTAHNDC